MTHRGLPWAWGTVVLVFTGLCCLWAVLGPPPKPVKARYFSLAAIPGLGRWIRVLTVNPWPQLVFRFALVALFLLVIVAGLFGSSLAEHNLATVLTWNLWWTAVVISVFFLGTAWCGVCPWDTLASWLVRRRLWRQGDPGSSLNLKVPRWLRSVMPALLLFIGLSWLELGVGVTTKPFATALIALLMVVLATVSLAIFERKAFCRYFCPVGRTLGFYAQLAPVELRAIDDQVCANCTTLDCYHGNQHIEPCPTHLVMGRLKQNTYCTSCGACTRSCPYDNISWRLRPMSSEAIQGARPHWDEAWFILALLTLTSFHGLMMVLWWEYWIEAVAHAIGDSGTLLWSFSIGLAGSLLAVSLLYVFAVHVTRLVAGRAVPFKRLFSDLAFALLPIAFTYHLAHNLNHVVRESAGLAGVLANPLGLGAVPLTMMERHARHQALLIPENLLFALVAGLLMFGFWIAVQVLRHRGRGLFVTGHVFTGRRLLPMLLFIAGFTMLNIWLIVQPMAVRVY
jgi:ferredoxin